MNSAYHQQQAKKFKKIGYWLFGVGVVLLFAGGIGILVGLGSIACFVAASGHTNQQHKLEKQEALYTPAPIITSASAAAVRKCPSCLQSTQVIGNRCGFCGCLI